MTVPMFVLLMPSDPLRWDTPVSDGSQHAKMAANAQLAMLDHGQ